MLVWKYIGECTCSVQSYRGHSRTLVCALVEMGSTKAGHGLVTYLQIRMKAMPTCKYMGLHVNTSCELKVNAPTLNGFV